jgi:hypothetical protein
MGLPRPAGSPQLGSPIGLFAVLPLELEAAPSLTPTVLPIVAQAVAFASKVAFRLDADILDVAFRQ